MAIATHEHFPQWTSAGISCPPDRGSCPEKDKARQGEQVAPSEFKAVAPGNVPVGHSVVHSAQKLQVGSEKTSRSKCADVAQLVEQLIRNQQVSGSNPLVGSSEMPVLYEVGLFRVSVTGDARRVMGALLGATCRR